MAVTQDAIDDALDRLAPLGDVTTKRMFGGAGFWESGDMFAALSDDVLYLRVDDDTQSKYEAAGSDPMTRGRDGGRGMPYFRVPDDVLGDDDRFDEWAREAIAVAHAHSTKR